MPPVTDSCLPMYNPQRNQKRHDRPIIERNTGHQYSSEVAVLVLVDPRIMRQWRPGVYQI